MFESHYTQEESLLVSFVILADIFRCPVRVQNTMRQSLLLWPIRNYFWPLLYNLKQKTLTINSRRMLVFILEEKNLYVVSVNSN